MWLWDRVRGIRLERESSSAVDASGVVPDVGPVTDGSSCM